MRRALAASVVVMLVVSGCGKKTEEPVRAPETATTAPQSATTPPVPASQSTTLAAGAAIPASGVVLWLVADDAKAGAGGAIESWGNAQIAGLTVDAEPGQWPALVPAALNGHAVARFDGTDDMLRTNVDISPARMPDVTVIAVFSSATAETRPLRKLYGDDNGGYDRAAGLDGRGRDKTKNYCIFAGSAGVLSAFAIAPGQFHLTVDQFSATDFANWVDGSPAITKTPAEWREALPNFFIGGTGTTYRELWLGDLAEMIVYDRALTEEERMQVEAVLAKKYALMVARPLTAN